jgi:hypothetical protein
MSNSISESDWKQFKAIHAELTEVFCGRVLKEVEGMAKGGSGTAHDRYLKICIVIEKRDRELGQAFDGLSRSRAFGQLFVMRGLGLLTDEYLSRFSRKTQDCIRELDSVSGGGRRGGTE